MLDAEFYRKQCARLREESEELLETVRQLRIERDTLAKQCDTPMRRVMVGLGVSPAAAKVFCKILDSAPKAIPTEMLRIHVDAADVDCIKVYVSRVRSRLRSLGCLATIRNVYKTGYYLTEADAHEVRMLLGEPVYYSTLLDAQDAAQEQRAVG